MASELARQILDAGFPAAKPVRDHDLFGIPTLEELIAAVEQLRPEVRLSVRRINPDEWEAHSGLLQSMVKSLIGHDMAQPPPKHWQSFGLPFTRHNRKRTTFVRTLPHNIERSSPQTKSPVACSRPTAAGSAYRAEPDTTALSSCPCTDAIADHAILSMYRKDIIGVQRIADVLEQWERPAHDWGDKTAWRLTLSPCERQRRALDSRDVHEHILACYLCFVQHRWRPQLGYEISATLSVRSA